MIPARFSIEYPQRCMVLLDMLESSARRDNLVGSLSLLVASSLFVIPYERMKNYHPLREAEREPDLSRWMRSFRKQKFLEASFWQGLQPEAWRLSRIVTGAEDTLGWRDDEGVHPMNSAAAIRD